MARPEIQAISPYFGLNVGNDINYGGANFNLTVIQRDAEYHVSQCHINYFRVAVANYNNAGGLSQTKQMAQIYLSLGANVQYGVGITGAGIVGNRAAFEAQLLIEAAYAQSVGIQRFQIGNEFALTNGAGLTQTECYDYEQTLPSIVRSAGYTGIITTSESQSFLGQWYSRGKGNYDDIGGDVYGSTSSVYGINNIGPFTSEINAGIAALGSSFYVSEWANDYGPQKNLNLIDPLVYSENMMKRLKFLESKFTKPFYMHCWRFNGNNELDYSAAKKDSGETRLFWFDIIRQRNPLYY